MGVVLKGLFPSGPIVWAEVKPKGISRARLDFQARKSPAVLRPAL